MPVPTPRDLPTATPPDGLPEALGVILCGGQGTRLGGADKAGLVRRGRTLLEHAAESLSWCSAVVAVGEKRPGPSGLVWTTELPRYGGPAAGLLAGIRAGIAAQPGRPTWVVALAVDMPLVTAETMRRLREACDADGAVLVDASGRRQHLCAIYRISALLDNAPSDPHGMPLHRLLSGLHLTDVTAIEGESHDIDVTADLDELGVDRRPDHG